MIFKFSENEFDKFKTKNDASQGSLKMMSPRCNSTCGTTAFVKTTLSIITVSITINKVLHSA
jgi:hypothetical protein